MNRKQAPVNNSSHLKSVQTLPGVLRLRKVRRHIDRIQFSIENRPGIYQHLLAEFTGHFESMKPYKKGTRIITQFHGHGASVELVYYVKYAYWLALSVSDPDNNIQVYLKNTLAKLPLQCIVNIKQIEFAIDLFPVSLPQLPDITLLSRCFVLKHSRTDSFRQVEETVYQGQRGNVRRGTKGLRCYEKVENDQAFFRLELQANRPLLRKTGINLFSLPVQATQIDIFRYIAYRQGISYSALRKLIRLVAQKRWPRSAGQSSRLVLGIMRQCTEAMLIKGFSASETASHFIDFENLKPVAAQIAFFKAIKDKYGITNQINEYFPKGDISELIKNLQKRIIKLPVALTNYST